MSTRKQGVFWILTIPYQHFVPYLPPQCRYVKGQLEQGSGGYLHWQCLVGMQRKSTLRQVKEVFGPECHAELTRSSASNEYVWKEDTRVQGTQFELGALPFERNQKRDWEAIWTKAQEGDLDAIPADVRVVSYRTLRAISSDHSRAVGMVRQVYVFWGPTGTGKSRRAWEEAGEDAYCKDPRTKFWDGYQTQEKVVIDEFRGGIY